MSIFDFIKRILGGGERVPGTCPQCGLGHSWNGRRCSSCDSANPTLVPSSTENRSYSATADLTPNSEFSGSQPDSEAFQSTSMAGLDTKKFAPISIDAALEETKSADWKSAYLDPMHIIPSSDLARIRVIDQTMVGLGLISDKELAAIHDIGQEFDKYRSDFHVIENAGARAVVASREEKARIRQQKKAEAAARKKAHAEAVALRRDTDIFFLGRGVSKGLADRRAHVERLNSNEIPVLATPAELAEAMKLTIPMLRWLAFHNIAARRVHYFNFTVPKKSGGQRKLSSPHKEMAAAQRWIFENVLQKIATHDNAHGFVTDKSIVTNTQPHVGADILINTDLSDFFPTINFWRVEGMFRSLGYSPAVSTIMALICTECPRETVKLNAQLYHVATGPRGLPQGACTSPAISNLVARHLDLRLTGMAKKLGWNYTRYADDITFSTQLNQENGAGPEAVGDSANKQIGYVLARIRHVCDDEGFVVNESKTRVLRNHSRQSVTGIVVNDKLSVDRKTVRKLRAILHNSKKSGLKSQNRENKEDFSAWLNGMISFVEMVNADQGRRLRSDFEAVLAREN
jgi:retron-type reverse transcriptase